MNNPVVLVHGIWDSSKRMKDIAEDLEKVGRKTFLIDLHPNDGSIGVREMALQLKDFVERNRLEKFDIVAFSMGGIVAKYYLAELEESHRVPSFVTISTPHQGTLTSFFYPFVLGKELRPHSEILNSLEEKINSLVGIKVLSLRTPLDLIIIPSSSSLVSCGENISIPVLIHPWMPHNKRVRAEIMKFLNQ